MVHAFDLRVYYEDTDLAGIVYYANYLKFIERARSEWVRALGLDQVQMRREGLIFAVRRVEADYLSPARFDDALTVHTAMVLATAARIVLHQAVRREHQVLFDARITLVCLDSAAKPTRLPSALRNAMQTVGA